MLQGQSTTNRIDINMPGGPPCNQVGPVVLSDPVRGRGNAKLRPNPAALDNEPQPHGGTPLDMLRPSGQMQFPCLVQKASIGFLSSKCMTVHNSKLQSVPLAGLQSQVAKGPDGWCPSLRCWSFMKVPGGLPSVITHLR